MLTVTRRALGIIFLALLILEVGPHAQNRTAPKITTPKEQFGWDIGFWHNYAKHQHWRNYYPRRVHGLKRAANFSEPMLDLAAG